jgi:outer membrane protein assembly factor BamB
VNNILKIILIFIFLTNCSFNKNSKFWTNEKISEIKKEKIVESFKKEEILNLEFNPNLKISFYSKVINKSFLNNYDNNNGRINYNGILKNKSKFKFSKIDNFHQYEPEILFRNNNIIFFDNKGSILKFDKNSDLLWKKNYYSKSEKKLNPILFFANDKKFIIVADNLTKYYALDAITGELIWSKSNSAPFNSQIKIYQDKFFIIDFENTLRAYAINNGKEIWNVKTENSLIRTQKKLSMVIISDKIYFNNSLGDISSVDINSGELIWQTPTQSTLIFDEGFFLKTSDIIADKNSLYFSNNKNQFFSLDIDTGTLNWQQKVNSSLRPTLIDNYIFTVSLEGYLIVIEKNSGNVIRSTDIFKDYAKRKKVKGCKFKELWNCKDSTIPTTYLPFMSFTSKKLDSFVQPSGFIVGKNNIYLTTNNGKLLIIDTKTGKTLSIKKIDNDKISRPLVLNQNLFIITDNSIIRLD